MKDGKNIFLFLWLFDIIIVKIGRVSMNRRGQALVEFVIILPIFILICFSVVDFGTIFSKKNELENISVDVASLMISKEDIDTIKKHYPDLKIDTENDGKYTTIKITETVDIITPGLNLVLGSPYVVKVERVIPND